ncbi:MAG: PIN domain-containing protein [Epsilonproteobacteria bacterium]|nr:PIN domain-containing protein [Campylobacterota bacterium]
MILLDANYILRYLLKDHEEMFSIAKETINNHSCMVLNEVVAEVVYVLEKVYKVSKSDLVNAISSFLSQSNISMTAQKSNVLLALQYYEKKNIDFVDGYLCALKDTYEVKTFDKKLLKCCTNK